MKIADTIVITECVDNAFYSVGDTAILVYYAPIRKKWQANFSPEKKESSFNVWWLTEENTEFELYEVDTISKRIEL